MTIVLINENGSRRMTLNTCRAMRLVWISGSSEITGIAVMSFQRDARVNPGLKQVNCQVDDTYMSDPYKVMPIMAG